MIGPIHHFQALPVGGRQAYKEAVKDCNFNICTRPQDSTIKEVRVASKDDLRIKDIWSFQPFTQKHLLSHYYIPDYELRK